LRQLRIPWRSRFILCRGQPRDRKGIARTRIAPRPLPLKHPLTFVLCIATELGCGADEFIRHRSRRCCSASPSALVPPPFMPFCPRHRAGVLPGKTAAPKWQPSTMPPRGPAGGDLWGFLCRGRKTTGNHGTSSKILENPGQDRGGIAHPYLLTPKGFALCSHTWFATKRLAVRSRSSPILNSLRLTIYNHSRYVTSTYSSPLQHQIVLKKDRKVSGIIALRRHQNSGRRFMPRILGFAQADQTQRHRGMLAGSSFRKPQHRRRAGAGRSGDVRPQVACRRPESERGIPSFLPFVRAEDKARPPDLPDPSPVGLNLVR
jgi:hypothetical protein